LSAAKDFPQQTFRNGAPAFRSLSSARPRTFPYAREAAVKAGAPDK
jgi:hypothetical protein